MDQWVIIFIVLSVVVFLVSFFIPQMATRGGKKSARKKTVAIPRTEIPFDEFKEEEIVKHDDIWELDSGSAMSVEDDLSIKGLRIAWKQFNSEMDALLRDIGASGSLMPYHENKYNELRTFYYSTLEMHTNVLSEQDQTTIKEKLAKAKQLIERY